MDRIVSGGTDPNGLDAKDDTDNSAKDFHFRAPAPTNNTGTGGSAPGGALSFLGHQSSRGIEVEAVFASPFMIASWFGYPISTVHEDGNFQLAGPGTSLVASGAILLTLLGFGIVLWWRVRRFHPERWSPALMYDVGFTVLLVMVITSFCSLPAMWLLKDSSTREGPNVFTLST